MLVVKNLTANIGGTRDVGSMGRRAWQPTSAFLPGESHGQRSLEGYGPQGTKSWTRLKRLSRYTHTLQNSTTTLQEIRLSNTNGFSLLGSSNLQSRFCWHLNAVAPFILCLNSSCCFFFSSVGHLQELFHLCIFMISMTSLGLHVYIVLKVVGHTKSWNWKSQCQVFLKCK